MSKLNNFTPAQVAWARVPKKLLYNYYQRREFLISDDDCNDEDRWRADSLRLDLSKRGFYPYYPDRPWINPENERQLSVFENQKASLHELIEELPACDIFGLWQIARQFVKFPVDITNLQTGQRADREIEESFYRAFFAQIEK